MNPPLKIGILCGSQRPNSQSARVGRYIQENLVQKSTQTYLLDLGLGTVPWWQEVDDPALWKPISEQLHSCDGFVVITPEWGGMVPPSLKNFFLHCTQRELAHKPGLIVSVSAGRGGSYPINELRTSSYKNTKIVYMPDHLILRGVQEYLTQPQAVNQEDAVNRDRLNYSVNLLLAYAHGLQSIRKSTTLELEKFSNGM